MVDGGNSDRLILVSGATGAQGGSVARALLGKGFRVRALTRNTEKPAAKSLAESGAEVVSGDLEDRSSLDAAADGAYGVFSVQQFFEAGYEGEVRQGKTLAGAAKDAGVEHLVYSSVGSAHRNTGLQHFESKREVEEHVQASGLQYTILRPVFFMNNLEMMREQILDGGTLAQPLDPDVALQQLSVDDIGVFATIAFENPDEWAGREVDIAGDELTMPQVAETISRVSGREISYYQVPWDQFRQTMGDEFTDMQEWFNKEGYEADIPALRKVYPELSTLDQYLRDHGWQNA